jgi:recombination protein RecT
MSNNQPSVALQQYVRSGAVQERLQALLDKRAGQFTTSLMSVVNSNPVLQQCKPETVLKAAITAAAMDLPIDPNLGFAYIIPYNNKVKDADGKEHWEQQAQFQMGYKGFIQLAQRSGHYKTINVEDVREGELTSRDRLSGDMTFTWIEDDAKRAKTKVIGYVAYFKLQTGFEKMLYMSLAEVTDHAKKYSKSFGKGYGLWAEKDGFQFMAKKTVLKLLISKYGSMSTQMQEAILADQSAIEEDGFKYVDNEKDKPVKPAESASDKDESTKKDGEQQEDADK